MGIPLRCVNKDGHRLFSAIGLFTGSGSVTAQAVKPGGTAPDMSVLVTNILICLVGLCLHFGGTDRSCVFGYFHGSHFTTSMIHIRYGNNGSHTSEAMHRGMSYGAATIGAHRGLIEKVHQVFWFLFS